MKPGDTPAKENWASVRWTADMNNNEKADLQARIMTGEVRLFDGWLGFKGHSLVVFESFGGERLRIVALSTEHVESARGRTRGWVEKA